MAPSTTHNVRDTSAFAPIRPCYGIYILLAGGCSGSYYPAGGSLVSPWLARSPRYVVKLILLGVDHTLSTAQPHLPWEWQVIQPCIEPRPIKQHVAWSWYWAMEPESRYQNEFTGSGSPWVSFPEWLNSGIENQSLWPDLDILCMYSNLMAALSFGVLRLDTSLWI